MGWSLAKSIRAAGAPVFGMFAVKTVVNLTHIAPGESASGIVATNSLFFVALWLFGALLLWVVSRIYPGMR